VEEQAFHVRAIIWNGKGIESVTLNLERKYTLLVELKYTVIFDLKPAPGNNLEQMA